MSKRNFNRWKSNKTAIINRVAYLRVENGCVVAKKLNALQKFALIRYAKAKG
jgi:hypothetical protein